MDIQLFGEDFGHLTPAVTRLPSASHGTPKPKGLDLWEKDVLPARTALAIWIGLSGVAWAIIVGLLYWASRWP